MCDALVVTMRNSISQLSHYVRCLNFIKLSIFVAFQKSEQVSSLNEFHHLHVCSLLPNCQQLPSLTKQITSSDSIMSSNCTIFLWCFSFSRIWTSFPTFAFHSVIQYSSGRNKTFIATCSLINERTWNHQSTKEKSLLTCVRVRICSPKYTFPYFPCPFSCNSR